MAGLRPVPQSEQFYDLFEEETNVTDILKWRDIYSNLERAVDREEDVANVLEAIVLKYA